MRLLRIFLLTLTALFVMGQEAHAQYGFDWIEFDQKYFKFKVGEEGIYRIDQSSLISAGVPLASINPKNIQIFRHGQEIPIYIEGESDNNFDATDYIEFYARENDGELDKALYRSPGEQPHDEISLMNDTAIYFLSWNNSTSNLRIVTHNDNNYGGKTSDDWIWYRSSSWFTNDFYDGSPYASPGYFTEFTEGEGWFSSYIARGVTRTFKMPTEHYNPLGPLAEYEFLLFGKSDPTNPGDIVDGLNHETQLKINGKVVFTQKFRGFKKILQRDTIATSEIGAATTDFNFASIYLSRSRHAVSYLLVDYPRHLTLDGSSQFAWDYTGSNDYFKFSNYPNGKNQPLVYDIANNRRIIGSLTSQDLEFNRTSGANGRILIRDQTDIISLDQFEEVSFNLVDPSNTNYDYLIITHPLLDSAATLYKQYRESQTGGGYNIHMVYTPDLYNLYYYGYHHPMALRNYLMHMYNNQANKPEYVLMLGKGQTYNATAKNTVKRDFVDLVPTWGIPPSDYPFVTDVGIHLLNPCMAIGRIPALNNTDIVNYLDKLKLHEQYGNNSKTLLQLTGGANADEAQVLRNYQEQYYQIAKGEYFGANRVVKYKDEAVSVTTSLVEEIQEEINKGVHVLGYFGHGAAQVLEVDIGQPEQLNNKGKYPLFLFEGCALGHTFGSTSLPEAYLFEPDNGGIAWIASSAYGFINELHLWSAQFYQNLYKDNYGESVGKLIQQTLIDYQNPSNPYNRSQCRQMTYHGDPAILLFAPDKPDYEIVGPIDVFPADVTAESDSFALVIDVYNNGKALMTDTPNVFVRVKYSNDSLLKVGPLSLEPVYNNKVFKVWVPNTDFSPGQNQYTIILDSGDYISELAPLGEFNNTRTVDYFMPSNSVYCLTPPKDAIIGETEVLLVAQNNNLLGEFTDYIFELDTTPLFNSPAKLSSGPVQGANLIEHRFNLPPFDSLDYYWRVRLDEDDSKWSTSTFSFIYGSEKGWSQGYYSKFHEANPYYIEIDDTTREFLFSRGNSITHSINISGVYEPVTTRRMRFNGKDHYPGFLYTGMACVAINPNSMERFMDSSKFNRNVPANNWGINRKYYWPGSRSGAYWFNTNNQEDRDSFVHYLNNIPEGYHLFSFMSGYAGVDSWEDTVFKALELVGAQKIYTIGNGDPYGLYGVKGMNPGQAVEITANYGSPVDPKNQRDNFATLLYPLSPIGSLTSRKIGPAKQWSSFYRTVDEFDNPDELLSIDIYGYDLDDSMHILYQDVQSTEFSLLDVKADSIPFIQIKVNYEDEEELTPAQLNRWTVLYEGVPEGALDPQIALYQNKDSLQEGDSINVRIAYRNIDDLPMDSVLVLTYLQNDLSERDTIEFKRVRPLDTDDYFELEYTASTKGLTADNRIVVSVNPDMDQWEQTLSNNIHNFKFHVIKDEKNPLLDVVFDGEHIMDEDIVPFNTVITMTVQDENEFLFIEESSAFEAILTFPDQSELVLVEGMTEVNFTPASKAGEKAILEFNSSDLPSGLYNLKVQVTDASGNKASELEYEINFKVIREATISNFYPYPNPFSSNMKFVFTLTGEQVPDYMKVQILTVSGKVVREIDQSELGLVSIGHNISEFSWDGTDMFGDQLANGVYLYKITAKLNGEDLKLYETAGDEFFKEGYGKIYLMR